MKPSYLTLAKTRLWVALWLLLALPNALNAQAGFTYVTNNGAITITDYNCSSADVTVPSTIGGFPVTTIGPWAFQGCATLRSVIIPYGVTNIGNYSFGGCSNLTEITVDPLNAYFRSVDGVLFDESGSKLLQFPSGRGGSYTISEVVTNIG